MSPFFFPIFQNLFEDYPYPNDIAMQTVPADVLMYANLLHSFIHHAPYAPSYKKDYSHETCMFCDMHSMGMSIHNWLYLDSLLYPKRYVFATFVCILDIKSFEFIYPIQLKFWNWIKHYVLSFNRNKIRFYPVLPISQWVMR